MENMFESDAKYFILDSKLYKVVESCEQSEWRFHFLSFRFESFGGVCIGKRETEVTVCIYVHAGSY
jgi:hypothetical protein